VEFTQLLNAGGIAGLVSSAIAALWTLAYGVLRPAGDSPKPTAEQHLALLLAHLVTGVVLGFIFWVSWGFTAIVGIAWWQRGLIFGLATWALCCIPLVSSQILAARARPAATVMIALQWLVTFVLASLACAWTWGSGR
jgi:hypothetical protein